MGAHLLGKSNTWKNTFRNRDLLSPIYRPAPALTWTRSATTAVQSSLVQNNSLDLGEEGQQGPLEDTGLLFAPREGNFRGSRKEVYFFLASFDKQQKESGHQEAFFEVKSAFAWISALASLKTTSKVNTRSSAMHHFLRPICSLI